MGDQTMTGTETILEAEPAEASSVLGYVSLFGRADGAGES